jgi:hypothetical protein
MKEHFTCDMSRWEVIQSHGVWRISNGLIVAVVHFVVILATILLHVTLCQALDACRIENSVKLGTPGIGTLVFSRSVDSAHDEEETCI